MAYLIFYIVFIASSSSLVSFLASCLPFFFGVVPNTFKNKVGNVPIIHKIKTTLTTDLGWIVSLVI